MDFEGAYKYIMSRLEYELPLVLTYHNAAHTKAVIDACDTLGRAENITKEELILVKTAALYHDSGYLEGFTNHEEVSCLVARESLPSYGYSQEHIQKVCDIIMATKMPQEPHDKLQQIICDADLSYLGVDGYGNTAEKLYNEFKLLGLVKSKNDWKEKQLIFLGSHRYFTNSAKLLYIDKKENHLKNITAENHKTEKKEFLIHDTILMIMGVLIAGFGLKGFLVPNHFFDGGITGLSLLVHEIYHFNLAYTSVIMNIPLIIVAYFTVSRSFAVKTFISIILLGLFLLIIPYPVITSDKLLISIFGGVFLGLGVGLSMRAGCALDGIEVLALYTLKRTSFTITEIIMGINIFIFGIAAFRFGIETALYSVLTYLSASRMIDYVIEGIQAYTGVTIISGQSEVIKHRLVNQLGRGITVYKGERGFLPGKFEVSTDCDIIFTVVTRLELRKLKNLVYDADPKAFVFANTIREASGGIIKRRQHH